MIYYLAHPYSGIEEASFRNACYWTNLLRQKGLCVFSPILHTHPYLYFGKANFDNGELDQIIGEDWLEWDLQILGAMMDEEGFCQFKCLKCGSIRDYQFECCGEIMTSDYFDGGVTVLLSNTAYDQNRGDFSDVIGNGDPSQYPNDAHICINWLSDGCRREYEFAKAHHIRVLELEAFLEGTEIEL